MIIRGYTHIFLKYCTHIFYIYFFMHLSSNINLMHLFFNHIMIDNLDKMVLIFIKCLPGGLSLTMP